MKIIVDSKAEIIGAPPLVANDIRDRLTIENPKYADAVKMGRWTGNIEQRLVLYDQPEPGRLIVPRGFINQVALMAQKHGVRFVWENRTRELNPVDFQFKGDLRGYQKRATRDILARHFGVCQASTGAGKTVLALYVIAQRRQPALVVVHSRELCQQWVERVHSFLGIPVDEIGVIGNGNRRVGNRITVALVQSLVKCAQEVSPHIGFLICDECHRTPSRTFTEAVSAFNSKFMLGLSATPYRRDRLTKLIFWHLGDRVASIDQDELTANGAILPFAVKWVRTDYRTRRDPSSEYSRMLSELTQDPARNRLICSEAEEQAKNGGGIPLVLSDRRGHCQAIAEALKNDHDINADVLTGDLSEKERKSVVDRLNKGEGTALVATSQLVGEGFDLPALGAVLLATPMKFKGRLIQAIGRALRPSYGQDMAVVVDFVDARVGVLEASAKKRLEVYRSLGAAGG